MKLWRVDDVMTRNVFSVREDASFHTLAGLMIDYRISAVPVVNAYANVLGVVSESDLLLKVEATADPPHSLIGLRTLHRHDRARGRTAAELMTSPAVLILPSQSIPAAARRMREAGVKRLPVEDDLGRLVGIVSRGDLLKAHLVSDEEISREIRDEVLGRAFGRAADQVRVRSVDGVVTLSGLAGSRSAARRAVELSRLMPGVVAVEDRLG